MTTKSLSNVRVKDEDRGEVTAVFATFNVIDKDGDVTLPGAFMDGAQVRISAFGHGSWAGLPPVGKGVVRQSDTEAILEGQFFLGTTSGRETFEVVKQLGSLQEWSYSVEPAKASFGEFDGQRVQFLEKLNGPTEVSPVLRGAGDTRTLTVKGSEGSMRFADEATAVLAAVSGLSDRAADVLAKRLEKGKGLGVDSATLLKQVEGELAKLADLLQRNGGEADASSAEFAREFLRFAANA